MVSKVTKRSMYEAIINAIKLGEFKYPEEDMVEFCQNEIAALDRKADKAREAAAAKKAEDDPLLIAVREAVGEEFEPISEIAARITDPDATIAKITARLTKLFKNGELEKDQITIPATETTKSRKAVAYRAI